MKNTTIVAVNRYVGSVLALAGVCLLFRIEFGWSLLLWAALLAALYLLVKPIYSLLAVPLDMFLFGFGTLCLDALMITLATPYPFAFWQALAAAAIVTLVFSFYEKARSA
ncbi:MAG: phage holin family protein [Oscillospiraceae bacterium]|nr:phage holin family protein [Oscillospiraceae bacterium]